MLRKLRIRFISISLGLIGIILLSVCAIVCYYVYNLHTGFMNKGLDVGIKYAKLQKDEKRSFYGNLQQYKGFVITTTTNSSKVDYEELYGDIPPQINKTSSYPLQKNDLSSIIKLAKEGGSIGEFSDLNIKYKKVFYQTKYFVGWIIAFVDTADDKAIISRTFLFSAIAFVAVMLIFFIVLIWLSYFVVKPIDIALKRQQQFLADASHELKTPLSAILTNNSILINHLSIENSKEIKWVENSQAEAKHMKNLIEHMLFLARDTNAENTFPKEPVSLSDVLTEILLQFEPIAFEEGYNLTTEIANDVYVKGDILQLRQLVYILLDNAKKYCNQNGNIYIALKNSGAPRLIVNNSGNPIKPEDLPHIFERFFRSDKSRSNKNDIKGYGLGLAIAKKIATRHRAKIKVTSDAENGTTFTVTFR